MILVRYILIFLVVYLLARGFIRSLYLEDPPDDGLRIPPQPGKEKKKKISRQIGEFVEYEEIKKSEKK